LTEVAAISSGMGFSITSFDLKQFEKQDGKGRVNRDNIAPTMIATFRSMSSMPCSSLSGSSYSLAL